MADQPPTRLEDLRRTDARVRFRCPACAFEEVHDRETLIRQTDWRSSTERASLQRGCGRASCDGWMTYAGAISWCDDPAELRRRVSANMLVNLACQVLKAAAYASARQKKEQPPVRLALRVANGFGADAKVCSAFWSKVTAEQLTPWDGCHNEFNWIVLALLRAGWSVWAEFR